MKIIYLFVLAVMFALQLSGQSSIIPNGFDYQAIVRDTLGSPKANQTVIVRFGLYPSQIAALPDYEEEHTLTSDDFGLIKAIIGQGTQTVGTVPFSEIDWKGATYYIEVKVKDGALFYLIGARQSLMSVPYALVAQDVVNSVPVGTIVPYMGTTAPAGWLLCDGSVISRTTYANLFSVIGNSCGNGNGSTTFNLPDFRGRFLRGFDGTAGNDPDASSRIAMNSGGNTGNNVGSLQEDAFQGHKHQTLQGNGAGTNINYIPPSDGTFQGYYTNTSLPIYDGISGNPRYTSETRPKNAYVNYIIKY